MPETSVQLKGLDRLQKAFRKLPSMVAGMMAKAGHQASDEILRTRGLRTYPQHGKGNLPPTPYYIRGVGTQYASFNAGNSERYGTKWTTAQRGYKTIIGNVASYAPYLAGERQARAMAKIGWKKLTDAVKEKLPQIRRIYQHWVNEAIKKAGL